MFAALDPASADRHEAILLGRETRTAQAETFLMPQDNGDGSYTGRFRIPELVDPTAPAADGCGANFHELQGAALCELLEHLPTRGHHGNACEVLVTLDLDTLLTGPGAARLDTGTAITAGEARRLACNAGLVPPSSTAPPCPWTSAGPAASTPAPNDEPRP